MGDAQMAEGKYQPAMLLQMFRKAAKLRKEMRDAGFTDNGGAIHSAERILNILGQRVSYPGLNHINGLKHYPAAVFSTKAYMAHRRGEQVKIEHVSPLRHLTQRAIRRALNGDSDEEMIAYVRRHYRLVLLTPEEMARLNGVNRSAIRWKRLEKAGITFRGRHKAARQRKRSP
jgi:hypothetical protein